MLVENADGEAIKEELNQTCESLENDTKTFEDLEFQYLEEETDWLAYREELHSEQKTVSKRIEEKRKHIQALETQGIDNQNTACLDTKNIEKELWTLLNNLEKCREELKTVDTLLFELSGQKNSLSDSDEDLGMANRGRNDIMSQSLFGSQDILSTKPAQSTDIMSKSVNENLFFNRIEMPSFNDTEQQYSNGLNKVSRKNSGSREIDVFRQTSEDNRRSLEIKGKDRIADAADPLQKLKYNLSPPFDHKSPSNDDRKVNLNLSIESDDFEVNPLEKRVPSQDDIDRICKVTLDAPISTQGASYKVIESIKEIERNRQLLLAQQGTLSGISHYFKEKRHFTRRNGLSKLNL